MAKRSARRRLNGEREHRRTFADPGIRRLRKTPGLLRVIAERLGTSRQAPYMWKRIPPQHVLLVEAITGIPACELRPDYYPRPIRRIKHKPQTKRRK